MQGYRRILEQARQILGVKSETLPEPARKGSYQLDLAALRKRAGLTQGQVKGFTQSNVSRLEARADVRLSTLLQYLDSLGMEMEITVRDRRNGTAREDITLLKV